jgi:hypothetical protein
MFQVLSQLGESGQLDDAVVQTIEGLIASKSLAVKEAFAKYRTAEIDVSTFSGDLQRMAAAEVA